jgi:porin
MAGLAKCARIIGLVAVLATAALPAPARGQDAQRLQSQAQRQFYIPGLEEFEDLLGREYLTGEWGGFRSTLRDLGIVPTAVFATDVQGNPIGGNRQGLRETNDLTVDVAVDLERLVGWTGGRFDVSLSLRSGTSLSTADIGNVFNVSQLCCGHTYRLVNVYLEQSLFGDALNIRAGRLTAGDEFLTSPLYWTFVQSAFNQNPGGILFNVPFPAYPIATWGARVRVKPVEALYVMAGAYNADATLAENGKHGVDWTMRGPLLAIGEIGYRLNQEEHAPGLPGNFKVGGFYVDGAFPDLFRDVQGGSATLSGLPPRRHHGNGGFYVLLDQMVYRHGEHGSARGLTPFVALLFSPDQDINPMPFFANGGLVYQGPFSSRPLDRAGLGIAYGAFSRPLRRAQRDAQSPPQTHEVALELTYILQVSRWLQVQPDVQYIINPGGTGRIRDALVIGFQIAVNL